MEHLRAWVDSPERAALIARIEPWLAAETLQAASGLEFLFAAPPAPAPAPRRYNQFFMTQSAIYPLATAVPAAVLPLLNATPWLGARWSSDLIVSGIVVYLMVYVVMPRYARLAAGWLNT
jgi:antibiotic biosynthesis monooxygenase (ABM) superfamily enzyme